MKTSFAPLPALLLTALIAAPLSHIHAQIGAAPDLLFSDNPVVGSQLFDAYNHCDLDKFDSFMVDDLDFYHDLGGFSGSRQITIEGVKNNIYGKVTRELVPGTLEVYPIANYGGRNWFAPLPPSRTGQC